MIRLAISSLTRRQRVGAAVLVAMLLAGAVAETLVFLLLIPLAQAVSTGDGRLEQSLGPFDVSVATGDVVLAIFVSIAAMTALRLSANYIQTRLATAVEHRERIRLFDDYIGASWELQAKEPPGRIQSIAGFATAKGDVIGLVANSSRYVLNISVMLGAAFLVAPVGAFSIAALGGAMFLAFRPLVAAARRLSGEHITRSTQHNEDLGELISIGADSRVFHAGDGFRERLISSNRAALDAKRKATLIGGSVPPAYQAIGLTLAAVILAVASTRDVNVGVLGAVVILLIRSMSYGQGLQAVIQKMAEYRPAIEALEEWRTEYATAVVAHGHLPIRRINSLELVDVSYRYDEDAPALHGVSLQITHGEQIGFVGPSGSGKSTIVQLILGLRTPESGRVCINERPIAEYDEAQLRAQMSLVPQKTTLFRGTVMDNIRIFRDHIDDATIVESARRAGLHDTILGFPAGYETLIGPTHRDVSGGQLQRLGIARALAGDPSLLVLDEPTSALDVDSEEMVTDTLRTLSEDVLVVVVAHRVSTLRHCNRIAVFEAGRLATLGPPETVVASSDFFRRAHSGSEQPPVPDH